jgi:hypothetical protein
MSYPQGDDPEISITHAHEPGPFKAIGSEILSRVDLRRPSEICEAGLNSTSAPRIVWVDSWISNDIEGCRKKRHPALGVRIRLR